MIFISEVQKCFSAQHGERVGERLELLRNKNRLIRSHDKNNGGLCLLICVVVVFLVLCLTFP